MHVISGQRTLPNKYPDPTLLQAQEGAVKCFIFLGLMVFRPIDVWQIVVAPFNRGNCNQLELINDDNSEKKCKKKFCFYFLNFKK